jgi:hypothetical protein
VNEKKKIRLQCFTFTFQLFILSVRFTRLGVKKKKINGSDRSPGVTRNTTRLMKINGSTCL